GAHLAHGDRIALAAGGASVETEAGPQVNLAGEEAAGKRDHVVFLARTVRVLGGDAERGLLPLAQSLQRLFQRRKDLPAPVQVVDGGLADARLDHLTARQADQVVHRNDATLFHTHHRNVGLPTVSRKRARGPQGLAALPAGTGTETSAAAARAANSAPVRSAAPGENASQRKPARSEARRRPMPLSRLYRPSTPPRAASGTLEAMSARSLPSVRSAPTA